MYVRPTPTIGTFTPAGRGQVAIHLQKLRGVWALASRAMISNDFWQRLAEQKTANMVLVVDKMPKRSNCGRVDHPAVSQALSSIKTWVTRLMIWRNTRRRSGEF